MEQLFKIVCNGRDISSELRGRVSSLVVTDQAGSEADRLSLTIADIEGSVMLPITGAELSVDMGYKESGLTSMGSFIIDNVKLYGPPDKMTVNASSANLTASLKEQKSRNFDKKTLEQLVTLIALENKLEAKIDKRLGSSFYEHVDQTEESDLNFLKRLADRLNAVVKVVEGNLVITSKGNGRNISDAKMPEVMITKGDCSFYNVDMSERNLYKSVRAGYRSLDQNETLFKVAGDGVPVFTIRELFADGVKAEAAAKGILERFTRSSDVLQLKIPGNPGVRAESNLKLSGFRDGIDGSWVVSKAVHAFNPIFTTTIEATKNGK